MEGFVLLRFVTRPLEGLNASSNVSLFECYGKNRIRIENRKNCESECTGWSGEEALSSCLRQRWRDTRVRRGEGERDMRACSCQQGFFDAVCGPKLSDAMGLLI